MTDSELWQSEDRPNAVLSHVECNNRKAHNSRKNRLFACGCYRLIWDQITLSAIKQVVELAEQRADRKVSQKQFEETGRKLLDSVQTPPQDTADYSLRWRSASLLVTAVIPSHIAWLTQVVVDPEKEQQQTKWLPCSEQADLARCVYGNPYRPVAFDPRWRSEAAVSLARTAYETRNFSLLPILADALEEAGCDHPDVLTHCRQPDAIHVRGCWVVDGVLGKT